MVCPTTCFHADETVLEVTCVLQQLAACKTFLQNDLSTLVQSDSVKCVFADIDSDDADLHIERVSSVFRSMSERHCVTLFICLSVEDHPIRIETKEVLTIHCLAIDSTLASHRLIITRNGGAQALAASHVIANYPLFSYLFLIYKKYIYRVNHS